MQLDAMDAFAVLKQKDQGIFLYGFDHSYRRNRDLPRFEKLKSLIKELDAEAKQKGDLRAPLYIFVEHAGEVYLLNESLMNGSIHPSIASGLMTYHEKFPFELSQVIDCEIRKVSGAAASILWKNRSNYIDILVRDCKKFDSRFEKAHKTFGCDLEQITFQDVCTEYETLRQKSLAYRDFWNDPEIKENFDFSLLEAQTGYEYLYPLIEKILHRKIFEYAKELCAEGKDQERESLRCRIIHTTSYFLDIFVYHSILSLTNKPVRNIAVFVGDWHRKSILAHHNGGPLFLGMRRARIQSKNPLKLSILTG